MSGSANAGAVWRPLRGIDARPLGDARRQTHQAVQWLARTARAYLPTMADDGHTSLGWYDVLDGFATHPTSDGARLYLNVAKLELGWESRGGAVWFSLDGRTDGQIRRWLGGQVAELGMDPEALDVPAPYALEANSAPYDTQALSEARAELAAWFANANVSLARIRSGIRERKLEVSEVRCWPHHFDLAALISFPSRGGETAYVGAGLSPGDGHYDEPYFYVSAYPRPDPATLRELRLPVTGTRASSPRPSRPRIGFLQMTNGRPSRTISLKLRSTRPSAS